jgi:hypothetical protein
MRTYRRRRRLLRRLVFLLAAAAVAAPVAQARVDGSSGSSGVGQRDGAGRSITDYSPAIAAEAAKSYGLMVQTDGSVRSIRDYEGPSTDVRPPGHVGWPGVDPHAVPPQAFPSETVPQGDVRVVSSPEGFDWGDAGIGAGLVFALMLLGGGALIVARQNRGQAAA